MIKRVLLAVVVLSVGCQAQSALGGISCYEGSKDCQLCKTPRFARDCAVYCASHCPSSLKFVAANQPLNDAPVASSADQSFPVIEPEFAKGANLFDRDVNSPESRLQDTLGRVGEIVRNDYPGKKYTLYHGDESPFVGQKQNLADVCPNSFVAARPCISRRKANERILDCCKKLNTPRSCLQHCNMEVSMAKLIDLDANPECTPEMGLEQAKCIAGDMDMRPCCTQLGVPPPCIPFCFPSSEPPPPTADLSQAELCAPILETATKIQQCFYYYQQPDEEEKKD